jgi:hypothetical protein
MMDNVVGTGDERFAVKSGIIGLLSAELAHVPRGLTAVACLVECIA